MKVKAAAQLSRLCRRLKAVMKNTTIKARKDGEWGTVAYPEDKGETRFASRRSFSVV